MRLSMRHLNEMLSNIKKNEQYNEFYFKSDNMDRSISWNSIIDFVLCAISLLLNWNYCYYYFYGVLF